MKQKIKTKLTAIILTVFMACSLAACGNGGGGGGGGGGDDIDSAGLVAHWQFEQGPVIEDLSGKGRDLSIVGTSRFTSGKSGQAFKLDGNTVLTFPALKAIKAEQLSLSFFINIEDFTYTSDVLSGNSLIDAEGLGALGSNLASFGFFGTSTGTTSVAFSSKVSGSSWELTDSALTNHNFMLSKNTWKHIAVVILDTEEDGYMQIYIDGEPDPDGYVELNKTWGVDKLIGIEDIAGTEYEDYRVCIGGYITDGGEIQKALKASIDDMRIYTRPLSTSEVKSLAQLY